MLSVTDKRNSGHVEVVYTVLGDGPPRVTVTARGSTGAYCNKLFFPKDAEVVALAPLCLALAVSPRRPRLGRGRLVSLQVQFFQGDVLHILDPSAGLGYRLCIQARPSPCAPASCANFPVYPAPSLFRAAAGPARH